MKWLFITYDVTAPLGKEETLQGRFDHYHDAHDAMFQYGKAHPNKPCFVRSVSDDCDWG
jgi:hypothetical protein